MTCTSAANAAVPTDRKPSVKNHRTSDLRFTGDIICIVRAAEGAFVKTKAIQSWIVIAVVAGCLVCGYVSLHAQQPRVPEVTIGSTDIGGVVRNSSNPEA